MLGFIDALRPPRDLGEGLIEQQPVARGLADRHEIVGRQIGPAHALLLRERMVTPAGGHEAFLKQGLEIDADLLRPHEVEPEVGLAADHGGQHLVGPGVQQAHTDLGVALVVARDHAREEVVDGGGHAGDGDFPHARGSQPADPQQGVIEIFQQQLDLAREVAPDGGELHAAGGAVEQTHAERLLELVDAAAEGWLGDVHRFGGLAEVAQLGDGTKGQQVVEVEVDGHGGLLIDANSGSIVRNVAIHGERGATQHPLHESHPALCPDARRNVARPLLPA